MKLTNQQKNILTIAGVGIGGFILYKGYKTLKGILSNPQSGLPVNPTPGCNLSYFAEQKVRRKADEIYGLVAGPNFLYYPDEINQIVGYTDCEIDLLAKYYFQTYGSDLRTDLENEWTGFGYYDPAINRLKQVGY